MRNAQREDMFSALTTDIERPLRYVRQCQKETHALQQCNSLFDHLVREGEQCSRDGEAELLRGFEVDDKLVFCRLHHRQVGRFFTFENASGVDAGLLQDSIKIRSIAHQSAVRRIFTIIKYRRQRAALRQRGDLLVTAEVERIRAYHQDATGLLWKLCKGRIDLSIGTGVENLNVKS
jgi:hypothetical protein